MSETVEQSGANVREASAEDSAEADVDIAIIGAGPGGLYTAWRLLQDPQYKTSKICLFDAAERLGGRILSVTLPEIPYVFELGAMRYTTAQVLVHSLIERRLALETAQFAFDTVGYHLRSRLIATSTFRENKRNPKNYPIPYYDLAAEERGKNPVELIVLAIQKSLQGLSLPNVDKEAAENGIFAEDLRSKLGSLRKEFAPQSLKDRFTGAEWRLIKRYGRVRDRPLWLTGFWDLVQYELTPEAYNLAHDGCGYQSILSMWNAADAILWFLSDFAEVEYRTIVPGMGTLTERLRADIAHWQHAPLGPNVEVFNLGWALQSIRAEEVHSGQPFVLTFNNEFSTRSDVMTSKTITARKVILALPQPALKRLQFQNLKVEENDTDAQAAFRFHVLLDSVTANPLFKAFIVYRKPWWRPSSSASCFRVYTDLPVRQVYHFGKDRQCPVLSPNADHTSMCVLLFYSDARYADYWKDLEQMRLNDTPYYNKDFLETMDRKLASALIETLRVYGTSDTVKSRIHDQLKRISDQSVPDALTIVVKHWSDAPYYAGWHSWKLGRASWKVAEKMVRPFKNADIFTCGEAFSSEQGWIEGALKSAERVLRALKVPVPEWVDEAEYRRQRELWL